MDGMDLAGTASTGVEVLAKPERRRFTTEYKLKVLREASRCTKPGEIGSLLRREGLYWSQLSSWRLLWDRGELLGKGVRKRGPVAALVDGRDKQIRHLERDNRRLRFRLERAEALIEVQKKVSHLLGVDLPEGDEEGERR
jgi:transposase-like protein